MASIMAIWSPAASTIFIARDLARQLVVHGPTSWGMGSISCARRVRARTHRSPCRDRRGSRWRPGSSGRRRSVGGERAGERVAVGFGPVVAVGAAAQRGGGKQGRGRSVPAGVGAIGAEIGGLELKATSRPSADMTPPADAELPAAPGAPSAPLTSVVVSVRSGPRRRPARRRPAVSAARLSTPGVECDDATVAGDPAAVCLAPAAPLGRLASAVDDPCGMTSDGQRKTFTSSLERPWGGEAVDAAARKGA